MFGVQRFVMTTFVVCLFNLLNESNPQRVFLAPKVELNYMESHYNPEQVGYTLITAFSKRSANGRVCNMFGTELNVLTILSSLGKALKLISWVSVPKQKPHV